MDVRLVQITIMGNDQRNKKMPTLWFPGAPKGGGCEISGMISPTGTTKSIFYGNFNIAVFVALLALTRALYVTQEKLLFCGVINLFAFLASPAALSYPGDSFIHVLQFRATLRNLMLLSVRVYHYPRLHAFFFISLLIRGCPNIMLWLNFTYCSRTKDG